VRVLVVEDNEVVAQAVADGLRDQGIAVDVAGDGATGLDKARLAPYDVIVLDRDLPAVHGDDVCELLADHRGSARILMLTAAAAPADRVDGLNRGADDYLGKPFHFPELVARIYALALPRRVEVMIILSAAVGGLAILDGVANYIQTYISARIGQGLIYDLRSKVFRHVQRQPLAFFTRTQTGSLVSRLNTDIVGAQQAITNMLSQSVDTILTLIFVIAAMLYLSWQISIIALALVPLFIVPGKFIGKRLQRITQEVMQLNAELGSMMNERFNVAGAMLAKLYGRSDEEAELFAIKAGRVRDINIGSTLLGQVFGITLTLVSTGALRALVILGC
jgi:DNA-binding response OmpR family regulator